MYEAVAPPSFVVGIKPGTLTVPRLTWAPYAAADAAGHHVIGYRVYRNTVPSPAGARVADESVLGPTANLFDDVTMAFNGVTLYYTLVSVEAYDYGARPYGEGGNVTVFGV